MTDSLPSESFARMADALERIANCLEGTSYEVPTVQAAWEQAFSEEAIVASGPISELNAAFDKWAKGTPD